MESLSRLTLYNQLSYILLSRQSSERDFDQALEQDFFREEINRSLSMILRVNIIMLSNLEERFLSSDLQPSQKEQKDPLIFHQFIVNIDELSSAYSDEKEVRRLIKKLQKLADEYYNKNETESQNSRNLFNKIINELGDFNSRIIPSGTLLLNNRERKEDMPQVFLSHAYDDRLYAWALFEYFYSNDIYLYVYWMHHGRIDDGIFLKNELEHELYHSSQLLFLRTLNSELDIQGKHMLRSWCAWELGMFYSLNPTQKYMLNLYSVDDYRNSNIQLHGLKLYSGILGKRLTGHIITNAGVI